MPRFLIALALALMAFPAQAESLLEVSRQIEQTSRRTALSLGEGQRVLTWGQEQARLDLDRLVAAASQTAKALDSGEHSVSPEALEPLVMDLGIARKRLGATLRLALLPEELQVQMGKTLEETERLEVRIRHLRNRFRGRDQPVGQSLAAQSLEGSGQPLFYENPEALLREARSIRFTAQSIGRSRPFGRGFALGWDFDSNLRDLRRAAWDFESAAASHYQNVKETRPAFERLQRAFDRVHPYGGDYSRSEMWELERALRRLSGFYAEA